MTFELSYLVFYGGYLPQRFNIVVECEGWSVIGELAHLLSQVRVGDPRIEILRIKCLDDPYAKEPLNFQDPMSVGKSL